MAGNVEKTRPWQENEVVYSGVGAGRFNDGEEVVVSGVVWRDGFETSILALRFLFPPLAVQLHDILYRLIALVCGKCQIAGGPRGVCMRPQE